MNRAAIVFPPRCGGEVRHPQSIVCNGTIGSQRCLPACTRLEMMPSSTRVPDLP